MLSIGEDMADENIVPNIYQRLNAVMRDPDSAYIQKDQKKIDGKYTAVRHDDVTAKLRPMFAKHGIVVVTNLLSEKVTDGVKKTSSGTQIMRYEATFEVKFVNADRPFIIQVVNGQTAIMEDAVKMVVPAHAEDQGDKAPGKAVSYAVKTALLKIAMMESGDNEEKRIEEEVEPEVNSRHLSEGEMVALVDSIKVAHDRESLEASLKSAIRALRLAEQAVLPDKEKAFMDLAVARAEELGITKIAKNKAQEPVTPKESGEAKPAEVMPAAAGAKPAPKGIIKTLRASLAAFNMSDEAAIEKLKAAGFKPTSIDELTNLEAKALFSALAA